MNVVIYTTDFEPITVVDLPRTVLDKIEQTGGVNLALGSGETDVANMPKCALIMCKVKWFNGEEKPILVTRNEENALLLKPDWLPGQRGVYNMLYTEIKALTKRLINLNGNSDE